MDGRPAHFATTVFRAQPDEGSQRKIQKRNRPPVSCLLCRTRKVKCDRQQPCERCVKSGEASFCEYAPRAARKPRSEPKSHHVDVRQKQEHGSRPVLQARLQKLEDMVSGLMHTSQNRENPLESPPNSEQRNETDSHSDLGSTPSAPGAPGVPTTAGPLPRPGQPGRLATATQIADSSYVGASHWASVLESIHDIRGLLDSESDMPQSPSPPPQAWTRETPDLVFGRQPHITHEQAVARLPSKTRTDQLVLLYFRSRLTAAPYIHTHRFQREYDGFWKDSSSVSLLWLSCLASILVVACSIGLAKGDVLSKEPEVVHPENLAALAVECLVAGDYLAGKPYSIEALMLHNFTEAQKTKEVGSCLWAKFGLLARLAQRMGYHRDPKHLVNVTPFEGEIRRRLWFFIETFDVIISFTLGIPPVIREDECDAEPPSNLFDSDFDENTLVMPPPRPASEPTSLLYLSYKSRLCRLLRRVIRHSMAIRPLPYEDLMQLDEEIRRYHNSIPQALQIRPIRSYSFTDSSADIMHRLMLELMYLKSLCVLHRPYLNREKDNPAYNHSRISCRDAALRVLELHAEYEEEGRPGGRLFDDNYMLQTLSNHDFLIASMIICLDLTENMPSSADDRTRKMKALGTSYKIWSSRKQSSPEAAHATRVVGAILRKISLQEPQYQTQNSAPPTLPPPPLPPPRPQPEVRDGSLASLLNNDAPGPSPAPLNPAAPVGVAGPGSNPAPPNAAAVRRIFDQTTNLMHAMDFSLDFSDTLPLDNVLSDPQLIDWNAIDQIIMERPENTFRTVS